MNTQESHLDEQVTWPTPVTLLVFISSIHFRLLGILCVLMHCSGVFASGVHSRSENMQTQAKKDTGKPCNCQDSQVQVGRPAADTLARVQISPHQDAAIRIRLIPGRDVSLPNPDPCGFGQTRPGVSSLSPALIDKLKASDKQVTAWLAKSNENARLFFADPVAALAKAGVELERGDAKAIARAHANASNEAVVMPGVRLSEVVISATDRRPSGKGRGDGGGRKPASDSSNCCGKEG